LLLKEKITEIKLNDIKDLEVSISKRESDINDKERDVSIREEDIKFTEVELRKIEGERLVIGNHYIQSV
jgi:uncharacterized protein (DUF3084 family)